MAGNPRNVIREAPAGGNTKSKKTVDEIKEIIIFKSQHNPSTS
jgi:hypothetical protein